MRDAVFAVGAMEHAPCLGADTLEDAETGAVLKLPQTPVMLKIGNLRLAADRDFSRYSQP